MSNETETPRTDVCPHCGAEQDPYRSEHPVVYGCRSSPLGRTELCREREARQKAEAEFERLSGENKRLASDVTELKENARRIGVNRYHEINTIEAQLKAEVERLKQWKDTLISHLMALEIYEQKHENDPSVALASYGQWNFKHGEWETQAEVEKLKKQLNRAVEIAERFRQVKGLHYQCNCASCQLLGDLKEEIK